MLVDIHCHILPGVDDGAPDMETSRAMIRDAYPDVKLVPYEESTEQMIRHLDKKLRPTMLGSRYVLTEFSTNDSFVTVRNYIYELITKGYRPIVAHVERYFCCQEPERIQKLKKLGAQIQINADSVLGYEGSSVPA